MFGIIKENLRRVWDALVVLSLGASAIDAGRSLGRITTHEPESESGESTKVFGEKKQNETHPCLSRRTTLAPRSRRVCAAERPASPPPTTITCAMDRDID